METKPFSYRRLFATMFLLSAFTFGGGYVIITLLRKKFVEELGWIDEDCLMDLISIAQAAPGPVVVNASILVGHHLGGVRGFLCSLAGTVMPPVLILMAVSALYDAVRENALVASILKTVQAAIAAIIADVVIGLGQRVVKGRSILSMAMMAAAFVAIYFFNVNIALVILTCGVIGAARTLWQGRGAKA